MKEEKQKEQLKAIDKEVVRLFAQRMAVSSKMTPEPGAARKTISEVRAQAGPELAPYAGVLFDTILELERSYRAMEKGEESPLTVQIASALAQTPQEFPEAAAVACQGVEGAYSQQAAEKLFRCPDIFYFQSFEGVFSAIDRGLCRYGVLPLENSTAGSVNAVYDLMMKYRFYIVRSTRLKIEHSLLAKKGVKQEEIREIYSHEQALQQCGNFLKSMENVRITPCANTAAAAKLVAISERRDTAALSSQSCAALYDLQTIAASVQNQGNNYTRFICISKELEIYPGADRSSVMLTVPHRPGSLYRILSRINALDINLSKLESRPIPDRDFEFMFYFDLDTSVYSSRFAGLMGELDSLCETFRFLGSYSERF